MNTKEIKALESYFKTENEHWNGYAFEMICNVLKQGNFKNPETPLLLFSKAIDIFTEQYETPLLAVKNFEKETDKHNLSLNQKLFVFENVLDYVKYSEFEKADTDEIKDLLKSHTERIKSEIKNQKPEYNKPLVNNIRDTLKDLMQKELENLSETLKDLEPVQRLNVLCKLIPYVLPKVEAVHSEKGEPERENKTSISGYQW
jgi:vacuolar-type H+-ATPase subunit I/STV1